MGLSSAEGSSSMFSERFLPIMTAGMGTDVTTLSRRVHCPGICVVGTLVIGSSHVYHFFGLWTPTLPLPADSTTVLHSSASKRASLRAGPAVKVREEQARIRPDLMATISGELLYRMTYTRQVVREVLRYRAPAPMVPQIVQKPFQLTEDYVAPKGAILMPSIHASCLQVNPSLGPSAPSTGWWTVRFIKVWGSVQQYLLGRDLLWGCNKCLCRGFPPLHPGLCMPFACPLCQGSICSMECLERASGGLLDRQTWAKQAQGGAAACWLSSPLSSGNALRLQLRLMLSIQGCTRRCTCNV